MPLPLHLQPVLVILETALAEPDRLAVPVRLVEPALSVEHVAEPVGHEELIELVVVPTDFVVLVLHLAKL